MSAKAVVTFNYRRRGADSRDLVTHGYDTIAEHLNEKGIPARAGRWHATTVMAIIRRDYIPEVLDSGRIKQNLDVLFWGKDWTDADGRRVHLIEYLKDYLKHVGNPPFISINYFVPQDHADTRSLVDQLGITFAAINTVKPTDEIVKQCSGDVEFAEAVQTALALDADALVINNSPWFPFIDDIYKLGFLLSDTQVLMRYCEIFVKGHDIPWSFNGPKMYHPWTTFYQMHETPIFMKGLSLLHEAEQKRLSAEGRETGRSLVHNRIPNLCFTRDRLLFYDMQRLYSNRRKMKRQRFDFEIGYHLNFYYPLIFGGFDQLALLTNQLLNLGPPERNVGATYKDFLAALKARSVPLHDIFTATKHVDFIKRVSYLRNYASHRGSLMPAAVYAKPANEPTDQELDAEIEKTGMHLLLDFMAGQNRTSMQQILRTNMRTAIYEREPVADGVIEIEIDGRKGFIFPLTDTEWNFEQFMSMADSVFEELRKTI